MLAIDASGIGKTYGTNRVEALRGVDLQVRRGEIFCMLGPNGAGKTTLVRILATQLEPSAGRATILGFDLAREAKRIRHRLATVPQGAVADHSLQVWEQIFYYLVARGMGWKEARRATEGMCDLLGLREKYREKIGYLSGGMRRRVVLAMALASPAELLYLDEPTAGLDVLIQRETWELLAALKGEKTIVLTTHLMQEAEALADRLAIIDRGRLIARGTAAELREMAPGRQKVVIVEDALPRERIQDLCSLRPYAGNWALYTRGDQETRRLLDIALEHHVEASVVNTTLEDTFIQLVGRHGDLGGEARR